MGDIADLLKQPTAEDGDSSDDTSDEEYVPGEGEDGDDDDGEEKHEGESDSEGSDVEATISKPSDGRGKRKVHKEEKPQNSLQQELAAVRQRRQETRERQHVDDLWSSFKSDVSKPKDERKPSAPSTGTAPAATKEFEFAGETVIAPVHSASPSAAKRPASGAAALLDRLKKKPKISTLEKSRLDWEGFKSSEGISEDLAAHNRGRDGFLERQAFLQRTDHRRFEIERGCRMADRKQQQKQPP